MLQNHDFKFKPSRIHLAVTLVLATLSLMAVIGCSLSVGVKCLLVVLLILYTARLLYRDVFLRGLNAVRALKVTQSGWLVYYRGQWQSVKILGDSTLTRMVLILRLQAGPKVISATIWRDALTRDNYRRLLVALRLFNRDQPAVDDLHRQSPRI